MIDPGAAAGLRRLSRVLGTILLIPAVVGCVAHYAPVRFLVILAAGSLWLMLSAVPAMVLLALGRARLELGLAALAVVIAIVAEAPLFVASAPAAHGPTLRIFTANLRLGLANPKDVVKDATGTGAQVILLQELTPAEQDRLTAAGLDRSYPYHVSDPRAASAGVGLWSRYPLRESTRHHNFGFALVSAQVQVPNAATDPTVISAHMVAPWPYGAGQWLADLKHLKTLMRSLARQGPVVVGGDFNATYDNPQYRSLAAGGFHDAVEQAGSGIVLSFPADVWYGPLIGIDHVLASGAVARTAHSLTVVGSDHRGLAVRLQLVARSLS